MSTVYSNEELAERIKNGETDLYGDLWEQTKRLFFKISNTYFKFYKAQCAASGVTLDDLQQVSFFALRDSVEAYKSEKGYKLSAYFRLHLKNRFAELLGIRTKHREPMNQCASMELEMSEEDDLTLADMISDKTAQVPFAALEDRAYIDALHKELGKGLATLSYKEREAVRLFYYRGLSIKEIAALLGISEQEVCYHKRQGLFNLNRYDSRNGGCLRVFLETPIDSVSDLLESAAFRGTGYDSFRHGGSSIERAIELTENKARWNKSKEPIDLLTDAGLYMGVSQNQAGGYTLFYSFLSGETDE